MPYTKKRSRSKSLKKYKKSNRSKPKYGKHKNSLKKNNKKKSKSRSNKITRSKSKSKTNKRSIKRSRSRSRSRKNRHKGGAHCNRKQTKCSSCDLKQKGGKCKICQLGGDDVDDINTLLGLASVKTKQEQRSRSRNPPKRLINEKNEKVIKIPRKKLSSKEKGKGIAKNRTQMKVDVKKIINKKIDSFIKDCPKDKYVKCNDGFKFNKKLGYGTCVNPTCKYINKSSAENLGLDTYGCYKCEIDTASDQLALDFGLLNF
jgi:hypothetical protein